jgi:hypothetical protein
MFLQTTFSPTEIFELINSFTNIEDEYQETILLFIRDCQKYTDIDKLDREMNLIMYYFDDDKSYMFVSENTLLHKYINNLYTTRRKKLLSSI